MLDRRPLPGVGSGVRRQNVTLSQTSIRAHATTTMVNSSLNIARSSALRSSGAGNVKSMLAVSSSGGNAVLVDDTADFEVHVEQNNTICSLVVSPKNIAVTDGGYD